MATKLIAGGRVLTLNFPVGMVIAFKANQLDIAGNLGAKETRLDLYNNNGDIVLRMTIRRGQNKIFFNDRAHQSVVDGWGQEKSVDLSPVDIERWHCSGITISVHNCSKQYQILFDLTTVFYFATRFPGPSITIKYSAISSLLNIVPQLSHPLKVVSYQLNTLPFIERQAITSGTSVDFSETFLYYSRKVSVPATGSAVISQFTPNKPCAITWDDGKEVSHSDSCITSIDGILILHHPDKKLSNRTPKCSAGVHLLDRGWDRMAPWKSTSSQHRLESHFKHRIRYT